MEKRRIVLVTGGSRGLGKNMATHISGKGMDVIITYKNNKKGADETISEIQKAGARAEALAFDMSDFASIDTFVSEVSRTLQQNWGGSKLYGLVNNAGMGSTVPFTKVDEAMFDEFMNVHFKGVYFLTQKLLPLMMDGGCVVNISSGTTRFSNPGYSVYASMKGAIEVFTRYLAKESGTRGIRANVVAPGPVETDFNSALIRSNPEAKARLSGLSPLGRVGEADDIGGVVAFLLSDEARWINGQRIEVSGGINT